LIHIGEAFLHDRRVNAACRGSAPQGIEMPLSAYARATTLRGTFEDLQRHHKAFTAHAKANGVKGETWDAIFALCHAAEFLEWAADLMADGRALGDPQVRERVQWAMLKLTELPVCVDEGEPVGIRHAPTAAPEWDAIVATQGEAN
jgi:hypothetical protein